MSRFILLVVFVVGLMLFAALVDSALDLDL